MRPAVSILLLVHHFSL